jgi:putative hemolysin
MPQPEFILRLAQNDADILAAQRLRYDVFVEELGAGGPMVDHEQRLEQDSFDDLVDHLILFDKSRENMPAVGVYRLLRCDVVGSSNALCGKFYSEDEYDLSRLRSSGKKLLELGRSCLHSDYRGGPAMMHLWNGLAQYIKRHEVELLFGVASFHGTDIARLKESLSLLHHRFLAPEELRTTSKKPDFQASDLMPKDKIDQPRAMRNIPALIKAYLRLGGFVGEGAYIDHDFNTTDICLILETSRISEKNRARYSGDLT